MSVVSVPTGMVDPSQLDSQGSLRVPPLPVEFLQLAYMFNDPSGALPVPTLGVLVKLLQTLWNHPYLVGLLGTR